MLGQVVTGELIKISGTIRHYTCERGEASWRAGGERGERAFCRAGTHPVGGMMPEGTEDLRDEPLCARWPRGGSGSWSSCGAGKPTGEGGVTTSAAVSAAVSCMGLSFGRRLPMGAMRVRAPLTASMKRLRCRESDISMRRPTACLMSGPA